MDGPFADKEIVLGVTGSIAAYKACDIASRLKEAGARVLGVLSQGAQEFLGAASLEGITGRRVITSLFEPAQNPDIEHIAVARRADLFLIAPASANALAKAAHGLADDWLSTTLLATRAPILFAPAMNMRMYEHPATQTNLKILAERGCHFIGPDAGALACGDSGPGRLAGTPAILEAAALLLRPSDDLRGKHVLITSGANHEPVDPVRYLGNRSSGRMGRALALEALRRGATVTVVTGPAETVLPRQSTVIQVQTAREMLAAVERLFSSSDVFIAAAAVADYHVENPTQEKLKRGEGAITLTLAPNPDIAAWAGKARRPGQLLIGFAAETTRIVENARVKLQKKGLDLIVANQVGGDVNAIGADASLAWILSASGAVQELPLQSKADLARQIFDTALGLTS